MLLFQSIADRKRKKAGNAKLQALVVVSESGSLSRLKQGPA